MPIANLLSQFCFLEEFVFIVKNLFIISLIHIVTADVAYAPELLAKFFIVKIKFSLLLRSRAMLITIKFESFED